MEGGGAAALAYFLENLDLVLKLEVFNLHTLSGIISHSHFFSINLQNCLPRDLERDVLA